MHKHLIDVILVIAAGLMLLRVYWAVSRWRPRGLSPNQNLKHD